MGLLLKLLAIIVLSIAVIFFAPGIPPHNLQFEAYTLESPLPLEGKLANNNILDKAEEIKVDREFQGPESIAFRGDEIFTGLIGGELVRIKNGKSTTIIEKTKNNKPCEGSWDVKNCGRIAGLRFGFDGKLYVADAANGIFKVDVDAGSVETLASCDVEIDGKRPLYPDDLDVGKDGSVYWSDASTVADVQNTLFEFLGSGTGRLIKYDPKTKKNTVLISSMHFSNGVQLSENEDFVLVTETARARVLRYYLKGETKGKSDIFIDRLPGLPDNVRPNGKGGFYIVLISPRVASEVSLVDLIGPLPLVRRFICRILHLVVASLQFVDSFFPSTVTREWIAYVQHVGPLGDLEKLPYKSIVVETDGTGNIIGSLQNEKGPVNATFMYFS
ncbi:Adipocyte plasma membrane-associated protein [Folsomia candida]|uniref:Adipocyte plasma membrane-associated protein n=1 Tax=Folsomia candida TaxID=158441 RepID=A0A226EUY0_FOLCA|nr:Adipocyte plasma membrane-associated protein [Folsomia candida]